MSPQLTPNGPFKAARFLWLTFDFAGGLPAGEDNVTLQVFLTLMAHPAIKEIKRFTANADQLGPGDVAQWEPGIFTVQAHRPSLLEVLHQVASCLTPHLVSDNVAAEAVTMQVYTQMGRKHYPLTTSLDSLALEKTASDIETMVKQHEQQQQAMQQ